MTFLLGALVGAIVGTLIGAWRVEQRYARDLARIVDRFRAIQRERDS